ncbi:P-loop containing nucleoside triphosphate hydrolase protein [Lipomyces japonicus]|uniref:P-loop containing nucleoside triphosphate hydrolase protein n=1 Tax=Lipomyces japonicus TaxID=56871 RepID=UPI0034CFFC9C
MPSSRRSSSAVATDEDQVSENESISSQSRTKRQRTADPPFEHTQGAIVRVAVRDFVTYEQAEFFPGPGLNMIIGPNGTGKSTLVSAICLGLGGKPALISRDRDIGEYVKMGKTKAFIEIELKGHPNQSNPVIGRTLFKDNRSEWSLNGKHQSAKSVKEAIDSFTVQIDNLCQFLPQDKVASFASMSPQDLLLETERATGSAEMLPNHNKLIELHKQFKNNASLNDSDKDELSNLDRLQKSNQEIVEQFRQRETIEQDLKFFQKMKPIVEYTEFIKPYNNIVRHHKQTKALLEQAKTAAGPSLEIARNGAHLADVAKSESETNKRELESRIRKVQHALSSRDSLNAKVEDYTTAIENIKRNRKNFIETLQSKKEELEKLKQVTLELPSEEEKTRIRQALTHTTREMKRLTDNRADELSDKLGIGREYDKRSAIISSLETKIKQLDSVADRKLNNLQAYNKDAYEAVMWLRQNKDKFSNPVFEPPYLSIDLKAKEYADAVETVMSVSSGLTFTCTSRSDYEIFTREVIDRLRLSVSVVEYSASDHATLDTYLKPCPPETLNKLGLQCWVLDLVTGPDHVLNMLCHENTMHAVGYAPERLTAQQADAVNNYRIDNKIIIRRYISGSESNYSNQSNYDRNLVTTDTRVLKKSRIFNTSGVNVQKKQEFTVELNQKTTELRELAEQIKQIEFKVNEINNALQGIKSENTNFKNEQDKIQKAVLAHRKLQTRITSLEEDIAEMESSPDTFDADIAEQEDKIRNALEERQNFGINLVNVVKRSFQAQKTYVASEINFIRRKSERDELQRRCDRVNSNLVELDQAYKEAKSKLAEAKHERNVKEQIFSASMAKLSAAEQERMTEYVRIKNNNVTIISLNAEIEKLEDAMGSIVGGNQHVVKQYEERQKRINELTAKVERSSTDLQKISSEIEKIRNKWEAELDELIGKVSVEFAAAFASIGCEGSVGVGKHEDYDKWCIEIRVRFREGERLQLLTHQRQSGGERSVSTIFYLMSLQGVTKAPFRVVDEINQGMDPRNERVVHSRMVDVACQEHSSQYFLITPKLLPDLKYHERMVVHCIFSGDHMPDPVHNPAKAGLGRLHKYAAVGRRLRELTAQ